MEFHFETDFTQQAFTDIAKVARKTVRKKKSRHDRVIGAFIMLGLFLSSLMKCIDSKSFVVDFSTITLCILIVLLPSVIIFEDRINGYFGRKRTLDKMKHSASFFDENFYRIETEFDKSELSYKNIDIVAETKDYFVFMVDKNHAQIYDKTTISGGSAEDFRKFITEKTGKAITQIK